MLISLIKKDFKTNKAIHMTLLLFLILSACLIASATIIILRLVGSINNIYDIAQPPHYLQMHKGEFSQSDIDQFVSETPDITMQQTIKMIDIDGGDIWISPKNQRVETYNLADSVIDNCFTTQNEKYDLLLNMNNQKISLAPGEIGVPIIYASKYDIQVGDTLTISNEGFSKQFIITTFVRDAQMNSSMVSSTRFLITKEDQLLLENAIGEQEFIMEFYFKDKATSDNFQTAYENAGLPTNGPAITYSQMKLLSSLSDMAMVAIILLVSLLLSFIAVLCVRFTILATLQEEVKEIGVMKAIGIPFKDIANLYLIKYKFLVTVGSIIGYFSSLFISNLFINHISETFGVGQVTQIEIGLPILIVFLNELLVIQSCKKVLKQIKAVTVVEALVGVADSKEKKLASQKWRMATCKKLPINIFYGIRDVATNISAWGLMFFVIAIATCIMIVPFEIYTTMKSPKFATYMGVPKSDIRIDLQTANGLQAKYKMTVDFLKQDRDIQEAGVYATCKYEAMNKENEWTNLRVECGKTQKLPIEYISGRSPQNENEIALSLLNAEVLGKEVGDLLVVNIEGEYRKIRVSGIYQDVTSGGYTAKMSRKYNPHYAVGYSFFINMKQDVDLDYKVNSYRTVLPSEVKIRLMEEYLSQTMGGMENQLRQVIKLVVIMALGIVSLITILFLKMHLIKDYGKIAAMKAIGFATLDIRKQYLVKAGLVAVIGIAIGIIISATFGQTLASGMLNMIGIGFKKIKFITNPLIIYILCPALLLGMVSVMTWQSTKAIGKYNIIKSISE